LNHGVFTPIRTERLLIRPYRLEDLAGLVARRNDPDVARYQDWVLPYSMDRAEKTVASLLTMDGPRNNEWWMALAVDPKTDEAFGDLAVHLTWEGRTAEVGYTFAKEHWGTGYATEALAAMVEYLFEELEVTRVFGMLHPDNPASAMVLERTGFLFEGHSRLSFWVGGEVSDDWTYGMIRPDWDKWRQRRRDRPDVVSLVEITTDNAGAVFRLATHKTQERFVATMAESFADALFPEVIDGAPVVPWFRAVMADDELAGFVMLALRTDHHPEPYLWRLLVDRMHQRRGIGARVIDLTAQECVKTGDRTLLTSWSEGKGSPRPFYLRNGFEPTGNLTDGETEARKRLA
jgi:RimJ/RimL family protein N-acetyltransferase/GNAT superfamily N-acetyltransferase